jgi:hypothetical protein
MEGGKEEWKNGEKEQMKDGGSGKGEGMERDRV